MTDPLPRIVHLALAREWRGGQRQVFLLARGLARRGIDQVVITSRASELHRVLQDEGVPVRPVRWIRGLALPPFAATFAETRRTPALVHAHDPHALILAGLLAGARRLPLVVTRRVEMPLRRPGFWARATRVIAISDAVRRALITSGVSADRIELVHSGIDIEATRGIRAGTIRSDLGLPTEGPLAVSVGALTPDKDHATLIRAAAVARVQAPTLRWVIAGTGPLRDRLETLIRDLDLEPVIHLVGHLQDPVRLIAAGDLFVSTSVTEGLGTSILDALALGRPVVATSVGGVTEILGSGAGLLAPPTDSGAIAGLVVKLLADPNLAREVTNRATQVVDQYSAVGMATGVLQVYRSMTIDR